MNWGMVVLQTTPPDRVSRNLDDFPTRNEIDETGRETGKAEGRVREVSSMSKKHERNLRFLARAEAYARIAAEALHQSGVSISQLEIGPSIGMV